MVFDRVRSASVARNVLDGFKSVDAGAQTKLRTAYEKKIHGHVIRTWLASHPKLVFPVVVFLLGTLTYTVCNLPKSQRILDIDTRLQIFDPIRALMVKAKMLEWFDPKGALAVLSIRPTNSNFSHSCSVQAVSMAASDCIG